MAWAGMETTFTGVTAAFVLLMTPPLNAGAEELPHGADLVLHGGTVYTVDEARPWARALAVRDGRIVYVGNDAGAAEQIGPGTRVIDLDGRMVLPGFHDSHIHPVSGAIRLLRCWLYDLKSQEAVYARVRECAAAPSKRKWLLGNGWSEEVFAGRGPERETLDRLVPDRPAFLRNVDGHAAWVNTRALAIAGVDAGTPDPAGGRIERNSETGDPTGTLRGTAVNLVRRHIPPRTMDEYREAFRRSSAMANSFGITSLIDASADETLLRVYEGAERSGELTVRVVASQRIDTRRGPEQVDELIRRRERYKGRRYRADAAKIFIDGGFQSRTAALIKPYQDAPDTRGKLNFQPEQLDAIVARLDAEGFQVHMHAVGDGAVRTGLNALKWATRQNGSRDRRHQIAHLALVDPADISRFRQLGVAADIQPLWAWADREMTAFAIPALGPVRSRRLIPIGAIMAGGARVVAGSDWPSPSMNPLEAMQIAMTRRPPDGSGPAWLPDQRAGLADLIRAYTISGAWLAREDDINGTLVPGKAADLIVLDRNLFEIDPMKLNSVLTLLTLIDGEAVYRNPDFPWPDPGEGRNTDG